MRKVLSSFHSFVVLILVLAAVGGYAQTITGSVNGTVTDASGALVPGAKVTATNQATNVQTTVTTNGSGTYTINFLQIGSYKVTIAAPGFAAASFGPFALETAQNAKVDAKLALEGQVQNVAVESSFAPLLNTENGALATTLDVRAIENIPMVGRDIVALTMFLPGSISTDPNGFGGQAGINPGGNTVSVNGNRQQTNQYLLDGMNINQTLDDVPGYNPSVDAIGQVQVITANASAEYGNVNGGDILYTTKTGTNQWHGSAFYFLGDAKLNANTWANKQNAVPTPRTSFTRNIFGGTFGGPIFKDKLFFFADYQGGRYHSGGPQSVTVLTAAERKGDFSELLNPALMCSQATKTTAAGVCDSTTRLIQLYDATNPSFPAYAGNKVSITNPAAIYLLQHPELYPMPNQAANATDSPARNNYVGAAKNRNYGDQFDVKIDWKATEKDSLSFRYTQDLNGSTTSSPLPTTFNSAPTFPIHGLALNEVHTVNSSIVNEFRAGYTRIQNLGAVLLDSSGAFGTNGNSLLGIGSAASAAQAFAGFSALAFGNSNSPSVITSSNGNEYTNLGSANLGTNFTLNTFLYGDDFTVLRGRHTIKVGVQFQRQQQNNFYPGNDGSLGGFYYLGAGTATPNADPNGYTHNGYDAADFLLNRASFVSKGGVSGPVGMRSWRDAYFLQDDWKVTPTLTLNYGVRYEYDQPIYEVNHKMSTIDPNNPGAIILDGTPAAGYGRGLVDPYYGSVMPRLGFSYAVTPRLVVRGGYGIQNFMEGTGANLRMTTNLPFQASYQANATAPTTTNAGSFFQIQNGFSNPASAAATSGTVYNVWNKHIKPTFIGEYSLTTEYQVSRTASVQIGYLGESGQHLVTANQRNQLHNPCVVNGAVVAATTATPTAACLAQAPAPFYTTPGVGYNGVVRYTDSNAMMNYNALQSTFRQRAWHGLQYTVNYTWSHAMTNSVGFYGVPNVSVQSAYAENVYDMHSEYGPAGQDVRNAANGDLVYDLPVGRGRMFGSHIPVILDEAVGGWKVGVTGIAYTGFPVTINTSTNNSGTNGNSQRANHYRQLKVVNRSIANWFGTDPSAVPCQMAGVDNGVCAYGQPTPGTFGTAHPDSERAPGYQTYGASVTKDFIIWHEQQINFRADADNIANSAYLSNPTRNVLASNFGQITAVRSGPRQLQLSLKYHF